MLRASGSWAVDVEWLNRRMFGGVKTEKNPCFLRSVRWVYPPRSGISWWLLKPCKIRSSMMDPLLIDINNVSRSLRMCRQPSAPVRYHKGDGTGVMVPGLHEAGGAKMNCWITLKAEPDSLVLSRLRQLRDREDIK